MPQVVVQVEVGLEQAPEHYRMVALAMEQGRPQERAEKAERGGLVTLGMTEILANRPLAPSLTSAPSAEDSTKGALALRRQPD